MRTKNISAYKLGYRLIITTAFILCFASCSRDHSGSQTALESFCANPATAPAGAAIQAAATANDRFTLSLYGQLSQASGNILASGYSVGNVLAMTHLGAGGNTATQLASALNASLLGNSYDASATALEHQVVCGAIQNGYTLDIANAAWVQKGFSILSTFEQAIANDYAAQTQTVDFQNQNTAAVQTINQWVSEQTQGLIPILFNKIPNSAVLVLTDAVYFNANWATPFPPTGTATQTFYANGSTATSVPMMNISGTYHYGQGTLYSVLELPYSSSTLSMVVFLPNARNGISAVEQAFTADTSMQWTSLLAPAPVQVTLPKFQFATNYDLPSTLKAMGITDMFTSGVADLSGIDGARDLFVGDFIHKAYIKTDEKGTEAAAASGETVVGSAEFPSPSAVFLADHPFLFLIRDTATNTILFIGRVADPSAQ